MRGASMQIMRGAKQKTKTLDGIRTRDTFTQRVGAFLLSFKSGRDSKSLHYLYAIILNQGFLQGCLPVMVGG